MCVCVLCVLYLLCVRALCGAAGHASLSLYVPLSRLVLRQVARQGGRGRGGGANTPGWGFSYGSNEGGEAEAG